MVHEQWFISDTHFFHANILKFVDGNGKPCRPFNDITDMHETIIKNWNDVVGRNDYVYHLGDVTFNYGKQFQELMWSLNGQKRLIPGNHDNVKQEGLVKHFDKIFTWKGFKEDNFTATHFPHRLDALRDGTFNVHGHTHNNDLDDPHYINVCVEATNYKPVHLSWIVKEIVDRKRRLKD